MTEESRGSRARKLLGRRGAAPAPAAPPRAPSAPGRPVDRIAASGLFDRTYYELQAGRTFPDDAAAIGHYQRQGRQAGLSPHPLFEPEWFAADQRRSRALSVLAYLDAGGREHGPGPLVDEAAYLATFPEADDHPGRALGHLAARLGDDDPLPVPPSHRGAAPTWRQARESAYASAREHCRHEALRHDPRRGTWDLDADAAFVEKWLGQPAPTAAEGPTVTVVMPVRNRPVQVREAIASVQAQTLTTWELVVVDDGSTDETGAVLDELAAADPRVRVLHTAGSGVSAARNASIAAATGRWLAFLDSDNTWVPHFLQVMTSYLEAHGHQAGHSVVDTEVESADSGRYLNLDAGLDHLLVRNHIDLNSLVVRTEIGTRAGAFDPTLRRWVDHDFAIRVARLTEIPLVPFAGVLYDHAHVAPDRITTTESGRWEWVVLSKSLVDWEQAAAAERVTGRTTIGIPTVEDWQSTRTAVDAVLATSGAADVEILVVVNGSRRSVAAILRALYDGEPRVRVLVQPRNTGSGIGANLAAVTGTGETVVFLDNDTEVLDGWLDPLLAALADDDVLGAQALLLRPDGSVWSAGQVFFGGALLPARFLDGHPADDAVALEPLRRTAVSGNALALRAADVIALRGFDATYRNGLQDADLCLRAGRSGAFRVVTESRVVHHAPLERPARFYDSDQENRSVFLERWADRLPEGDLDPLAQLGLAVAHLDPGPAVLKAADVRSPRPVVVRPAGSHRLRWALKTSVPLRASGHGDLVAARALAEALRALGQDVVVDPLESNGRETDYLDDVTVAIRGADALAVVPGRINLLYALDGAGAISAVEAARYDATFDAGESTAAALLDRVHALRSVTG